MSAIAGIFYKDGKPVAKQDIDTMLNAMYLRANDQSAVWADGSMGMGCRMMYATPESVDEALPYENDQYIITCDARIDNREELFKKLSLPNEFQVVPDSILILKAYERWEEKMPEHLLGDFAFAIWDKRKQHLFCARDIAGIKSFYYFNNPQQFLFSTEIKSILSQSSISRELNRQKIITFLINDLRDSTSTIYKDVVHLPPGHSLFVSRSEIRVGKYWELTYGTPVRFKRDEEYAEAFREVMGKAVQCRLRSAYRVGSGLSGGLDSSMVTFLANEHMSRRKLPLDVFSLIFDQHQDPSDKPYIEAAVSHAKNLVPHYINGDELDAFADFEQANRYFDDPNYIANLYLFTAIYKEAQASGVRVLLEGFGGDSVVSYGIDHLKELFWKLRWMQFTREMRLLKRNYPINYKAVVWNFLVKQKIKEALTAIGLYHDRSRKLPFYDLIKQPYKELLDEYSDELHRKKSRQEQRLWLIQLDINKLASGIVQLEAGRFHLEVRYPFLDKRVLTFCINVNDEQNLKGGYTRSLIRRAMKDSFPAEIAQRKNKGSFTRSYYSSLQKEILGNNFNTLILTPGINKIISTAMFGDFLKDYQQHPDDAHALFLWNIKAFHDFLQRSDKPFSLLL